MLTIFDVVTFGSVLTGAIGGTVAGSQVGLAAAGGGLAVGIGVGCGVGLTGLLLSGACMHLLFRRESASGGRESAFDKFLGGTMVLVLCAAPIGSLVLADLTASAIFG